MWSGIESLKSTGKSEDSGKEYGDYIFYSVYANLPLSPRVARHFPPCSGEADAKEKRNHDFYINKNKNIEMVYIKKPFLLVGK